LPKSLASPLIELPPSHHREVRDGRIASLLILYSQRPLLDGAASVFEDGGTAVDGVASEAQVDLLYRQIGQLKVENDLYEGLGVKQDAVLLCAAMTAAL